jgi:lysozyme
MKPHTSKRGLALITTFEGLRLQAYKPTPHDVWTIGVGHTHGVHAGMRISRAAAMRFLRQDVAWAEAAVIALRLRLNQNQFDALVSFVFNLGAGILAPSHDIGRLLRERHYVAAANSMLEYSDPGTVEHAGLLRRRKAERHLFLSHPIRAKAHQLAHRAATRVGK